MFGLNKNKKEVKKSVIAPTPSQGRGSDQSVGKVKNRVALSGDFKFLTRPVVSEKALGLEARGKYIFLVSSRATKPEIKKEVASQYGVKVEKVNMVVYQSEKVLFKGREGSKPGFKKAIVKLAAGQKIEVLPK